MLFGYAVISSEGVLIFIYPNGTLLTRWCNFSRTSQIMKDDYGWSYIKIEWHYYLGEFSFFVQPLLWGNEWTCGTNRYFSRTTPNLSVCVERRCVTVQIKWNLCGLICILFLWLWCWITGDRNVKRKKPLPKWWSINQYKPLLYIFLRLAQTPTMK